MSDPRTLTLRLTYLLDIKASGYFAVKSMAWCLCCKLIFFYHLRKWRYGWGQLYGMRGWMVTRTILKLLAGIRVGMGIRVTGTVGDGYKYLSPCISLVHSCCCEYIAGRNAAQQAQHARHFSRHWTRHQPTLAPTQYSRIVAARHVVEIIQLPVVNVETRPESPGLGR